MNRNRILLFVMKVLSVIGRVPLAKVNRNFRKNRDMEERKKLLDEILQNDDWIIEGLYYKWCKQCFADADKIYLLNVPRYKYRYRIIRRFIRRKLGVERGKKETLKSLCSLLKWADEYQEKDMVEIRKILAPYLDKVIEK